MKPSRKSSTPAVGVCILKQKKINGVEHQAVVLKNAEKEIKLKPMVLIDGKSSTIYEGIKEVLDEYDLWSSIKMIVSDKIWRSSS